MCACWKKPGGKMTSAVPADPPLYGLVLAGGRSRRMGADKSGLRYREDTPHAGYTARLLEPLCVRVFYSCRADQAGDPLFAAGSVLCDVFPDWGPLGGILSAQQRFPHAAFLVLACDLPFLRDEPLQHLLAHRDAGQVATAFHHPVRQRPEPLCAIYEPRFAAAALPWARQGVLCPTQLLLRLEARLIPPPDARFLENANRPEDYQKAKATLATEMSAHA